jgi:hypothetical protein
VRQAEVAAAKTMIARARDRFDLHLERLAADTGYGSAEMPDWLVNQQGIEPHAPVFDKSQRTDGTFSRTTALTITSATLCLSGRQRPETQRHTGERWRPPVLPALLNPAVARMHLCGEYRAASTKAQGISLATSPPN